MRVTCIYTGQDTRTRRVPDTRTNAIELKKKENTDILPDDEEARSWRAGFLDIVGFDVDVASQIPDDHSSSSGPRQADTSQKATNLSTTDSIFKRSQDTLNKKLFAAPSSIFTFGDPPPPETDCLFFALPPFETIATMIELYFEFVTVNNYILHRPTIGRWAEECCNDFNVSRYGSEDKSRKAVILMILATSHPFLGDTPEKKHIADR